MLKKTFFRKDKNFIYVSVNGIELTGLSENLIKGKQKLDMKLKRMCSKRHTLKRTGIHSVLEASKHTGTISAIEKENKCIIKLPQEIDESVSVMLSDFEVIEPEMLEGNIMLYCSFNSSIEA